MRKMWQLVTSSHLTLRDLSVQFTIVGLNVVFSFIASDLLDFRCVSDIGKRNEQMDLYQYTHIRQAIFKWGREVILRDCE